MLTSQIVAHRRAARVVLTSLALATLVSAASAQAQSPGQDAPKDASSGAGLVFLGVPVGFLSDGIRGDEGLSGTGWGICLGGALQLSWFDVMLDFGFEHYNDSKAFRQSVVDQYGNVSTAESRVNLSYFAPAAGLKTPVFVVVKGLLATTAALNLGWSFPFDTDRQIVSCEDCDRQSIDVKGGPFVEPAVELLYPGVQGALLGLGISWQQYLGDSAFDHKLVFRGLIGGQF